MTRKKYLKSYALIVFILPLFILLFLKNQDAFGK